MEAQSWKIPYPLTRKIKEMKRCLQNAVSYELLLEVVLETCVNLEAESAWFTDKCSMSDEEVGEVEDDSQVSDLSKWYPLLMVKSVMR